MRRLPWTAVCAATLLLSCTKGGPGTSSPAGAPADDATTPAASDDTATSTEDAELQRLAVEAWVYGYPLVLMDATRRVATAVPAPGERKAPVNQFGFAREFPDHTFRDVVRPNADTLYSTAYIDVAAEPVVLSVPASKGRYYVLQMLDAWTNVFASPGPRTNGDTKAHTYAIVGPNFSGQLPEGLERIDSPTSMVWLIGRAQTNTKSDYGKVHQFQDGLSLTPLSKWGSKYEPPEQVPVTEDLPDKPPEQSVREMSAGEFFARLATLMKANPAPSADAATVAALAKLGIVPGAAFDIDTLEPSVRAALEQAPAEAMAAIVEKVRGAGTLTNGWRVVRSGMGSYGTDYLQRAAIAFTGLGANLPEDALYPMVAVDADGHPLSGANKYVIHFDKGREPPAKAFWSITAYADLYFIDNPIGRYAIGDRDALKRNADGSLDIYVQHDEPKGKRANWLPVGEGPFDLVLRLYWPAPAALDGSWEPPAVTKAP